MLFSWHWLADYVTLPSPVEEGAKLLTAAGFNVEFVEAHGDDLVLDVDVTTNRPDAMNHLGLAREMAVILGEELRLPEIAIEEQGEAATEASRVEIEAPQLCRRYVARVLRGVRIGPSPPWLVDRLEAIGLRSINNVVDVTNFVLWETGQPLHAFDLSRLAGRRIVVRNARAGETLRTLDGEDRELDPEMLVIADAERPVALAGIMGGEKSEVGPESTDLLLESAWFDPTSIRRTARRLGMHTDASHRFERGADPEMALTAANRAASLIQKLAGGNVLPGVLDIHPRPFEPLWIPLSISRLSAFAGISVEPADAEGWLRALGCTVETGGESWRVRPPSWRSDLELPADLYEEILRHYGYDAIPATLPAISGSDGAPTPRQRLRRRLRNHLCGSGFAEAIQYAFIDREADGSWPSRYGETPALELANPLSDRYTVMRRSLLPGLYAAAEFNQRRGAARVQLFEIGHVFATGEEERETLALVTGGQPGSPWDGVRELDIFDLKGRIEAVAALCGTQTEAKPEAHPALHPGRSATIWAADTPIGVFGQVAGSEDEGYPLFVAEIELDALEGHPPGEVVAPSRFPGISVDLTLTHSLERSWAEIAARIGAHRAPELQRWELLVRYRGEGVPEGCVNTSIRFHYGSSERSLTQDEVNRHQEKLDQLLTEELGAS